MMCHARLCNFSTDGGNFPVDAVVDPDDLWDYSDGSGTFILKCCRRFQDNNQFRTWKKAKSIHQKGSNRK